MFLMKRFNLGWALMLLCILLSACGPSPEQEAPPNTHLPSPTIQITKTPAGTAAPTTLEILKDMDPTYEINFDGEECIVEGPSELNPGEYVVILHNQTDLPLNLWLGSYFGEGTFDDHLLWREENCGGQGTHCEDEEGNEISYTFAKWHNPLKQAQEGKETYFKLYEITLERQYFLWVSLDRWWGWNCAPIQVSK